MADIPDGGNIPNIPNTGNIPSGNSKPPVTGNSNVKPDVTGGDIKPQDKPKNSDEKDLSINPNEKPKNTGNESDVLNPESSDGTSDSDSENGSKSKPKKKNNEDDLENEAQKDHPLANREEDILDPEAEAEKSKDDKDKDKGEEKDKQNGKDGANDKPGNESSGNSSNGSRNAGESQSTGNGASESGNLGSNTSGSGGGPGSSGTGTSGGTGASSGTGGASTTGGVSTTGTGASTAGTSGASGMSSAAGSSVGATSGATGATGAASGTAAGTSAAAGTGTAAASSAGAAGASTAVGGTAAAAGSAGAAAGGTAAAAGGTAAAAGAGAGLAAAWPVLLIILAIIIIIGVVGFLTSIPGLMIGKLKDIAQGVVDEIQSWFTTGADAYINDEDVVDLANYLEEMEYDLIGYGFINADLDNMEFLENLYGFKNYTELREEGYIYYETRTENGDNSPRYYNEEGQAYGEGEGESGYYYNSLGILIDNSTGEIAELLTGLEEKDLDDDEDTTTTSIYVDKYGIWRSTTEMASSGEGLIYSLSNDSIMSLIPGLSGVDDTLLRSYLLSDYRIYTIRNNDEDLSNNVFAAIKSVLGGYNNAWSKGLLKFYYATDGVATAEWTEPDGIIQAIRNFFNGGSVLDIISISGTTLTIQSGVNNNPITFDIEGWSDRYGMSLEFLLSLHLATMAPDLVYAMLQSFDTEVQVYLNDSGEAEVDSAYVDLFNDEATIDDGYITYEDLNAYGTISRKDARDILEEFGLVSPDTCTYAADVETDILLESTTTNTDAGANALNNAGFTKDDAEDERAEIYNLFDENTSDYDFRSG